MDNYSSLVERIASSAGLSKEEIERKVEAKRAKLSGLVSKEGAAQIVAAELGINFEKERMKLAEIVHGMKRANVLGKILTLSPVRSFNKNNREGKVVNLTIADQTGNAKAVLWDMHHIALVEQGKLKEGDVIELLNCSVRNGELHLSSFSDIRQSSEKLEGVVTEQRVAEARLSEVKPGQRIKTRAFIVQTFEPRYFEVCPECSKRVVEGACVVHGAVTPQKRALLNVVVDDGSETLRAVLFGDHIYQLGLTQEEVFSYERFATKKESLLGEEKFFQGTVRTNSLYNTLELSIDKVQDVEPAALLAELETHT